MVDRVAGDADIGLGIVCQHGVPAIGVARPAREIAAGHVDLDAMAGRKSVVDMTEIDGQPLDAVGCQCASW